MRMPGTSRDTSPASGIPKIVILDENQMYAHYMRRLNREWMRHIEVSLSIVDRDADVVNKTKKRGLDACSGPITRRRRTAQPRSHLPSSLLHTPEYVCCTYTVPPSQCLHFGQLALALTLLPPRCMYSKCISLSRCLHFGLLSFQQQTKCGTCM